MLAHVEEGSTAADQRLRELVVGFDMVNEEDFTDEIQVYAEEILTYQNKVKIDGQQMPTCFHAGETHDRNSCNL